MDRNKNFKLKLFLFLEIWLFGVIFSIVWLFFGEKSVNAWNESIDRKARKLF